MDIDATVAANMRLESGFVNTADFRAATLKARGTLANNGIMAIDGIAGLGKSTTARYLCATLQRPSVLVTMPSRPAPLHLLRQIAAALDPDLNWSKGSRWDLQHHLVLRLTDWHGVLIIDELARSTVQVLGELTLLYEEIAVPPAVLVVGTGCLKAVAAYEHLDTRLMSEHTFTRLTGDALTESVRALDPRFANLTPHAIRVHDDAYANGRLRGWIFTLRWGNTLNPTTKPFTEDDLRLIRSVTTNKMGATAP